MLCRKLFVIHQFHFRHVFSTLATTNAYSQTLFSHFASTKLNMSQTDITRMCKWAPPLQRLQTLDNVKQFIDMLNRCGCSQVQIVKIMRTQPSLIITSAERILEPKIKLLEDFGFQGKNLTKLLTRNPHILGLSVENVLIPNMEFLKNVFQPPDSLVRLLLRAPFILGYNLETALKPSLAFWEGWGFEGTELSRFIQINPSVLQRSALMPAQADLIRKIGADKGSKLFKYIVSIVAISRMETLEDKIENLKLCGLSTEEIWQVFRSAPQVFYFSKENVSEKMNILVNKMELPVNYVVKHPSLLKLSLEKATRPRFLVWQKIKSISDFDLPLLTVLTMTEARFVSKIIKGHPESKALWTIYENAISNASNDTKSSSNFFWNERVRVGTQKPQKNILI